MSNQPRFEVFPEAREVARRIDATSATSTTAPTGQFVWHFKDANGKITFTGGEPFTRREDAHRSIIGTAYDYAKLLGLKLDPDQRKSLVDFLSIIDLDENGKVIA